MKKKFNVYKHPELGYEAVKIGCCWPALFNIFWMWYKSLWAISAIWVVLWFIQGIFENADLYLIGTPLFIFIFAYPVYVGNKWLEIRLGKKGYELVAEVEAVSSNAAIGNIAAAPSQKGNGNE